MILWEKTHNNIRYEVRSAGKTRRLYENGVMHSQYHPDQILTRHVWDLLFLPALLQPVQRVLMLGVGGGAVIHLLNHFLKPELIVGVELNAAYLKVAKRYFGLEADNLELVQGDAVDYVQAMPSGGFDLIIEDLFCVRDGEPERAIEASDQWLSAMRAGLSPMGMLVMNFVDYRGFKQAAMLPAVANMPGILRLTNSVDANHVGAFMSLPATGKQLKQRLYQFPLLDTRKKSCLLDYALTRFER